MPLSLEDTFLRPARPMILSSFETRLASSIVKAEAVVVGVVPCGVRESGDEGVFVAAGDLKIVKISEAALWSTERDARAFIRNFAGRGSGDVVVVIIIAVNGEWALGMRTGVLAIGDTQR